jgi:hypothetical protein
MDINNLETCQFTGGPNCGTCGQYMMTKTTLPQCGQRMNPMVPCPYGHPQQVPAVINLTMGGDTCAAVPVTFQNIDLKTR